MVNYACAFSQSELGKYLNGIEALEILHIYTRIFSLRLQTYFRSLLARVLNQFTNK